MGTIAGSIRMVIWNNNSVPHRPLQSKPAKHGAGMSKQPIERDKHEYKEKGDDIARKDGREDKKHK